MDLELIERLIEIVAQSGMAEVEVEQDDFKVVVRAHPNAVHAVTQPAVVDVAPANPAPLVESSGTAAPEAEATVGSASQASGTVVPAPIVGTFYEAPSPDSDPYVTVGDRVEVGSVLCIIEAMKLMNEIQSEHAGVIKQVLAVNAQPVEFDQPLFIVEEG